MGSILRVGTVFGLALLIGTAVAAAQEGSVAVETQPAAVETLSAPTSAPDTLTLGWMFREGGAILWVIGALSFVTVVWAVYLFLTVTPGREVPANFVRSALTQIRGRDLRSVYQMCEGHDSLFARVLRSGLRMTGHDRYVVQDAMESEGERGATALWQKISYLNNIGVIAPLLGLLGTVWGMIYAFGGIAMSQEEIRQLKMAEGVAKAMITTLAGLCLAIPTLGVYYYLRGRVIRIIAEVEARASEIIELLTRSQES